MIDDGSTDSSPEIAHSFSIQDKRFRLIQKLNGGLSDARNAGLDIAQGQYIVFIDSDDFIGNSSLSSFKKSLKSSNYPDVLITRLTEVRESQEIKRYIDDRFPFSMDTRLDRDKVIRFMFTRSQGLWPAVRYILNRDMVENNQFRFLKGMLHEDVDWTTRLFLNAHSFSYCDYWWYNHRIAQNGTITSTPNVKRLLDVVCMVNNLVNYTAYDNIPNDIVLAVKQRLVMSVFSLLRLYPTSSSKDKQAIRQSLQQHVSIFQFTIKIPHRIFNFTRKIFGWKIALSIYSLVWHP